MSLTAPTIISAFGRNGRAQFLWQGVPGAASYNCYRDGVRYKSGIPCNLWIDFGLTNGQEYAYTFAAAGQDGSESPHSGTALVTPAAPTASQYRFRNVLGQILRWLIETDALPAINAAFRAQSPGTPLLTLTQDNVVRGVLQTFGDTTINVEVMGEMLGFTGSSEVHTILTTHIMAVVPRAGQNEPENFAFAGDVIVDTLRDMLTSTANFVIPAINYQTGNWMLPGCASFQDCRLTRILRLNAPTTGANNVTRAPAWLLVHEARLEYSLEKLHSVGG